MHAGEMCTCHTSHAHSPHTSRDAPCGVCLGVWRVVFWPSWCLVHHTTMTPFKRARRGEWPYACWRDVHVPHVTRTLTTHESRCTLWRVFGSMACCFLAKLVLGPPHYHGTFQTCQTWRVGVCMLARCARAKSHALSPHTSRDAPCGVCLGVWRVVFWPSWCLVHHTTMTPFKRARRGEWAYACWRDVHVSSRTHTHHTPPCGVCMGVWRVVFWPSWCLVHHTTMTPFKRARRGEWAYACWRDVHVPSRTHTHHTRVEMHLVACVWEYGVLFFGQVGAWSTPPHYHDTFQTCQTWRVGVCMLARCARAKSHA